MRHQYKTLCLSMLPFLCATHAVASGFALSNQSIVDSGLAGAGGAVLAQDASVVFSNPAAMSQLAAKKQYAANLSLNIPSSSISDAYASTGGTTTNVGSKVDGSNDGDMTPKSIKPSAYMVFPFQSYFGYDDLMGGIGLYAPYGYNTNYEDNFQGRLFADKTKLDMYTASANISFPVFDSQDFTVGAGYEVNRATGTVSQSLDTTGAHTSVYGRNGGSHTTRVGLFYKASPSVNLAAKYSSKNDVRFVGGIQVRTPAQTAVAAAAATSTTAAVLAVPALPSFNLSEQASFGYTLPKSYELSASYKINPTLTSYLSYTHTNWAAMNSIVVLSGLTATNISTQLEPQLTDKNITLTADQRKQAATTLNNKYGRMSDVALNFKDADTLSFGLAWQKSPVLVLRGGLSLDESPTDAINRSIRLPLGSSLTLGLGAGYKLTPRMTVDVAYRFIKGNKVNVNQATATQSATYFANLESKEQSLAVQLSFGF